MIYARLFKFDVSHLTSRLHLVRVRISLHHIVQELFYKIHILSILSQARLLSTTCSAELHSIVGPGRTGAGSAASISSAVATSAGYRSGRA